MPRRLFSLGVIASHPIQYQAPLFRHLAANPDIDLTVYFCSSAGVREYYDQGFGTQVRWDIALTSGYRHKFLRNWFEDRHLDKPWGHMNPETFRILSNANHDAILVHGWYHVTMWIAVLWAKLHRVPVLLRGESNGLQEPSGAKGVAKSLAVNTMLHFATRFLAIGSNNRDFYRRHGICESDIYLAPYSVDNDFFQGCAEAAKPERERVRAGFGAHAETLVIAYCGKLSEIKRPLDLLVAVADMEFAGEKKVLFIGDGSLRSAIESKAHELGVSAQIHVTGFVNQSQLANWYSAADVFVLPSCKEPWGLVVNEAMNFGLPIVASDRVGSVADLVSPGNNGFIFPSGDVGQLTKYLDVLAGNRGMIEEFGQRSLAMINGWGIEQTTQGILEALASLSQNERGW